MSNTIKLKSVRDLMQVNYFIPSYQRGYRWTNSQVKDLLNDIYSFADKKGKSDKEFYCLQPIVVRKVNDKNLELIEHLISRKEWDTYEVIDGQQRLTTIKILLIYLLDNYLMGRSYEQRFGMTIFDMIYETRPELKAIFSEKLNILCSDTIDSHFITNTYFNIGKWFEERVKDGGIFDDLCDSIIRTLVYSEKNKKPEGVVQVIWYEINDDNVNPIETFLRINLGKIPLTNGELVKALFLQNNLFGQGELAEMHQIELANKWDFIERSLREEKFWWFISNEEFDGSTRIDFILNLYYQSELEKNSELKEITGDDNHQIFRFYNHLVEQNKSFAGIESIWKEIENIFDQINEWYSDSKWYHYIGFLIYKNVSILDIFQILRKEEEEKVIKEEHLKKSELTNLLIKNISEKLKKLKFTSCINLIDNWEKDENEGEEKDKIYLDLSYREPELVRDILLLYNLQYIVRHSENNGLIYKFPFHSFKNMKNENGEKISWDIEHIDSSTDKELGKFDDQKIWLENALLDISELLLNNSLIDPINIYISRGKAGDDFQKLYENIKKVANEDINDDRLKNNIGNLALLDSTTNRGYGNALFISKRRIIIEKDIKGTFIPQLTKNVFLKYTNVNNLKSHWTKQDIELYNQDILSSLSLFIKP